jgi:putative Mn2+ efflux pump MntP
MGIEGLWILPCAALIALTTFCFSFFGVGLGKRFGKLLGGRARIIGGVVLIGIGVKVFVEHTLF